MKKLILAAVAASIGSSAFAFDAPEGYDSEKLRYAIEDECANLSDRILQDDGEFLGTTVFLGVIALTHPTFIAAKKAQKHCNSELKKHVRDIEHPYAYFHSTVNKHRYMVKWTDVRDNYNKR